MLRLAEDHRADAQGAPSRGVQSTLDLYLRLRRLQSGAHESGRRSFGRVSRGRSASTGALEASLRPGKYRQSISSTPSMMKTERQNMLRVISSSLLEIRLVPFDL